jgi:Protein of unknown function (DUF3237)
MPTPEHPDHVLQAAVQHLPVPLPHATLLWTAAVHIAPREALGAGPLGGRAIVPILGGVFWGGPGHATLCGTVRSGGADRQLVRADGIKELRAEYEMQCADGSVLTVDNRVLVDESRQPERYALSHLFVSAPEGPHAWLNRRVLVGTLQSLRPQHEAVVVRAFMLDV